ncbi:MAG: MMPL family transporter, partial [Pseudomonadota bacterium]
MRRLRKKSLRNFDPNSKVMVGVRWLCRFPIWILVVAALLTVVSVWLTTKLNFTTDLTALLPEDHPDLKILKEIRKKYSDEVPFMVLVSKNYLFAVDSEGSAHVHDNRSWHHSSLGTPLFAIWGRSATQAFAAGANGYVARFDGKKWSPMPATGTQATLRGIWGNGSGHLYVVGDNGTILKFDGQVWAPMASGIKENLRAIFGQDKTSVYAVGDRGTVLRLESGSWQRERSYFDTDLLGGWVAQSGELFVSGQGGLFARWKAGSWKEFETKAKVNINSVWGSSPEDVYSVGDGGAVFHWDGQKIIQEDSTSQEDLLSIYGLAADKIWAAGDLCTIRRRNTKNNWYYGPFEFVQTKESPLFGRGTKKTPCKAPFTAIWRPENDMIEALSVVPKLATQLSKSSVVGRVEFKKPIGFFKDRALFFLSVKELQELAQAFEEKLEKETAKGTGLYLGLDDGEEGTDAAKDKIVELYKKYGEEVANFGRSEWYLHPDESSLGIVVYSKPGATGLSDLRKLRAEIDQVIAGVGSSVKDPMIQIDVGGDGANRIFEYDVTIKDVYGLAWIAVAGIAILLFVYFRQFMGLLFVVVPLGMSITWTFALTTLTIGTLNIVTGFLFAVLFGLGIDYGFQLFGRFREERGVGCNLEEATNRMILRTGRATLTSGLTSSLALLTLTITDFKGFSEFGFIAGIGVLFSLVGFLLVLPAVISVADRFGWLKIAKAVSEKSEDPRVPISLRLRKPIVVVASALVVLGLYGALRVQFEYDNRLLRPADVRDEVRTRAYDTYGGSFTPTQFLAPSREELEAALDAIENRRISLGEISTVRKTASLLDLVPKRQHEKSILLEQLAKILHSEKWRLVGKERKQRIKLEQLRQMALAKPFDLIDLPEGVRRSFRGPGFGDAWVGLVFYRINISDTRESRRFKDEVGFFTGSPLVNLSNILPSQAVAHVEGNRIEISCNKKDYVKSITEQLKELRYLGKNVFTQILDRETAQEQGLVVPGGLRGEILAIAQAGFVPYVRSGLTGIQETGPFHVSSSEVVLTEVVEVMLKDSKVAFLLALLTVFCVCLFDFRSIKLAIFACLPIWIAILWTLGALHFLGLRLNMFNFVIFPVLVGVGIDYGVHYVHRFKDEGAGSMRRVS